MSYDRIILKESFTVSGKNVVNTFKAVDCTDFVQIYVSNGEKYGQMRLSKDQAKEFKIFLEKWLDESK